MDFLANIYTPTGVFVVLLLLGVVFVNGWTDAPNAIATGCITKALSFSRCALLCGVFNLVGVIISPIFAREVSENVFSLVGKRNPQESLTIVIATLITTILFGVVAWFFGMPSSESHAMLCGLLGASAFFGGSIPFGSIGTLLLHLAISLLLSLTLSLIVARLFVGKTYFKSKGVVFCLCATSLMHGSQDGQKFVGIFKAFLSETDTSLGFFVNLSIILSVAIFMLLGSLLGGKKIIKTYNSTSQEHSLGYFLSSDVGTIVTILLCSLFGMPISTGIVKLFSLVGASLGFKKRANKKVAISTLSVALATLPICFILGYFIAFLLTLN